MSWNSRKKKEYIFCVVFYLNVECIEYTFKIYSLLHIYKNYFIHFFAYLNLLKLHMHETRWNKSLIVYPRLRSNLYSPFYLP